jgi:AcrR family transcriptional regulator
MQPGAGPAPSERTFIETQRRAQIVAAAIDTIAEVGYAQASLGRIAARIGISRGLISYHFAGKDELMSEVVREVLDEGRVYMTRRILAHSTGPEMLRAYIESNLAYLREHPKGAFAVVEIARHGVSAVGQRRFYSYDIDDAVRALAHLLSGFQDAGQFRADFDPRAVAIAIRGAIDAASRRVIADPQFDIDNYATEIARVFEAATGLADPAGG